MEAPHQTERQEAPQEPEEGSRASSTSNRFQILFKTFSSHFTDHHHLIRLIAFLKENWKPTLSVIIFASILTIIVVFFQRILEAVGAIIGTILLVFLSVGGIVFAFYIAVAMATVVLSIPFLFVLIFKGALRHPKEMSTIKIGRSLLASALIVILGGIYADTLEASFAYGALNLRQEIVRGYAWIVIAVLLVGYLRALYGEGLTAHTNKQDKSGQSSWGLLLRPPFIVVAVLFELIVPVFVASSVLLGFKCEGYWLTAEVMVWIGSQFSFLTPILTVMITYFAEIIEQTLQFGQVANVIGKLLELWTAAVSLTTSLEPLLFVKDMIADSKLLKATTEAFTSPSCNQNSIVP